MRNVEQDIQGFVSYDRTEHSRMTHTTHFFGRPFLRSIPDNFYLPSNTWGVLPRENPPLKAEKMLRVSRRGN
jgi:hypothetical protein